MLGIQHDQCVYSITELQLQCFDFTRCWLAATVVTGVLDVLQVCFEFTLQLLSSYLLGRLHSLHQQPCSKPVTVSQRHTDLDISIKPTLGAGSTLCI